MKALVIGQGSIGQRHARILPDLGLEVFTVSRHLPAGERNFHSVATAISSVRPGYVVVANATSDHLEALTDLRSLDYDGRVLVEKPLFAKNESSENFKLMNISVGYNLRFHPLLQRLQERIGGQKICSVSAYVGQYLPAWRPDRGRESYSYFRSKGGGVLRDLSHELDYLLWLFGDWKAVTAISGKFSDLDMDSDDTCSVLMRLESSPSVVLELNGSDRISQRWLCVNTTSHTYRLDFTKGTLQEDGTVDTMEPDWNGTYLAMHRSILSGTGPRPCTFSEGKGVMELVEAIEKADRERKWVVR